MQTTLNLTFSQRLKHTMKKWSDFLQLVVRARRQQLAPISYNSGDLSIIGIQNRIEQREAV